MKKTELVKILAVKGKISYLDADDFVNLMFEAFAQALLREERIAIRGFGNFTVRRIRAGTSHNPKTGAQITLPERRLPFFKAGKDLLNSINNR